jgi:hypothetical protein
MKKKAETKRTSQDAYLSVHAEVLELVSAISEGMFDLQAPGDEIHWGHVGDVTEIARQLKETLAHIRGCPE